MAQTKKNTTAAYRRGKKAGFAEGYAKAKAEVLAPSVERLHAAMDEVAKRAREFYESQEADALRGSVSPHMLVTLLAAEALHPHLVPAVREVLEDRGGGYRAFEIRGIRILPFPAQADE